MNDLMIITGLTILAIVGLASMRHRARSPRFGIGRAAGSIGALAFSALLACGLMAQPAVASSLPELTMHQVADCGPDSHVNSDGQCVHAPESAATAPDGATAQCSDGTYSFSQHRSGTCSGHGGVARWL
ncbi:hypothetical protein DUF 3761 [Nocardia nova SH22a]|uniref:DUF3761 domain-containing protein n=1 Tax=Nocardia nova SH22a TaxID=1415166 RepID=W5TDI5_9NOCA|nr:DUF3761 domain-containing protein [Nocardia nova]AHH17048.1 hypothetical protein DUF 3761 [Nocardia nova SH22a]